MSPVSAAGAVAVGPTPLLPDLGPVRARLRSLATTARTVRSAGYVHLLAAQVAPLGVSFLLTMVSATLLGPERRGVLTFLMTGSLLVGALAYGSLHVPVVDGLRSGDGRSLRHGVRLVAGIWLLLTTAGAAVAFLARPASPTADPGTAFQVGLVLVGGAIAVTQLFAGRVLQGLAENSRYVRVVVGQAALYLVGTGAVLLATRSPLLMFGTWYVSVLGGLVLAVGHLRTVLQERAPHADGGPSWRSFARSATANNVGSIGQMVMLRADVLVVGLVLGPVATGVYGIALSLTELALIAPEVFALAVYGNRARMADASWVAHVRRTVRVNLVLAVAAAAVIAAAGFLLVQGPLASYRGLVPLMLIVLPGVVLAGYTRIALSALQALGATVPVWRFGVLALVLSLGFLPGALLGVTGPAVVSSVAYGLTALFLHVQLRTRLAGVAR
ncbi:hypothetical protein [Modestobacter sp. NPDC049651]|uniref:lipopolysaccharide biosynthesis protein n=1 Tax=unclassified Modestobacter TaxID=2643866 RepID=UPI0033CDFCB3